MITQDGEGVHDGEQHGTDPQAAQGARPGLRALTEPEQPEGRPHRTRRYRHRSRSGTYSCILMAHSHCTGPGPGQGPGRVQ